jgi:hypothetical protein
MPLFEEGSLCNSCWKGSLVIRVKNPILLPYPANKQLVYNELISLTDNTSLGFAFKSQRDRSSLRLTANGTSLPIVSFKN